MTGNLDSRKTKLIERISSMSSEKDIAGLENYLTALDKEQRVSELFKPMKDTITVQDLKKEQSFDGIDRAKFEALAKQLEIQESLEELLSMID
ncbi:MAG: hypothetical protein AAGG75_11035 [Bacteroidota bacterium]